MNEISTLDIQMEHVWAVNSLPPLHRDPFDRMLIAQAQTESMPIISGDPLIAKYPVDVIW